MVFLKPSHCTTSLKLRRTVKVWEISLPFCSFNIWIVVCKLRIKSDAIYLRDIFFYVKMLSTFYIRG